MHLLSLGKNRQLIASTATCIARANLPDTLYLFLRPPPASLSAPLSDESAPFFAHFRSSFLIRLRKQLVEPGNYIEVAVSDAEDPWWDGKEEVIGYAKWERNAGTHVPDQAQEKDTNGSESVWSQGSWTKSIEHFALSLEGRYSDLFLKDPFINPTNLAEFGNAWASFDSVVKRVLIESLEPSLGYIWLQSLAVDPSVQRRGVGMRLMKWGVDRAKEEKLPVALMASVPGQGLYRKCGFEDVGENLSYGPEVDHFMVNWAGSIDRSGKES